MALAAMVLALGLAVQAFVSFLQGTPLLEQLFLFHHGLPQITPAFSAVTGIQAAIAGLTLHLAGYVAERTRAGILGVDRSQWNATQAVGMAQVRAMRRIILPQAAHIAAMTLLTYFMDMMKVRSLAFTLRVTEMMGAAQKEAAGSSRFFEVFLLVAIIYWMVMEMLSLAQRGLEWRLNRVFAR